MPMCDAWSFWWNDRWEPPSEATCSPDVLDLYSSLTIHVARKCLLNNPSASAQMAVQPPSCLVSYRQKSDHSCVGHDPRRTLLEPFEFLHVPASSLQRIYQISLQKKKILAHGFPGD